MFQQIFGDRQSTENQWTSNSLGSHSDLVATQLRGNLGADNSGVDGQTEESVGRKLPRDQVTVEVVVDQLLEGEQQYDIKVQQLAKFPAESFLERREQICCWDRICCYAINDTALRVMDLERGSSSMVHIGDSEVDPSGTAKSPVSFLQFSRHPVDGWPLLACATRNSSKLAIRRISEMENTNEIRVDDLLKADLMGGKTMENAHFAWHPSMKFTFLLGIGNELFLYSTNLIILNSSLRLIEGEPSLAYVTTANGTNITSVGFDAVGTRFWYGTDNGTFTLCQLSQDGYFDPATLLCSFFVSTKQLKSWNVLNTSTFTGQLNQPSNEVNKAYEVQEQVWIITSRNESEVTVWDTSVTSGQEPQLLQKIVLRKNGMYGSGMFRSMYHYERQLLIFYEMNVPTLYSLCWDGNGKRLDNFVMFKLVNPILSACFLQDVAGANEVRLGCRLTVGVQEHVVDCGLCMGGRMGREVSTAEMDSRAAIQNAAAAQFGVNSVQGISVATSSQAPVDFSNIPLPASVESSSLEIQKNGQKPMTTAQQYGSIQLLQRQSPGQPFQQEAINGRSSELLSTDLLQVPPQTSQPSSTPTTDLFSLLMPDIRPPPAISTPATAPAQQQSAPVSLLTPDTRPPSATVAPPRQSAPVYLTTNSQPLSAVTQSPTSQYQPQQQQLSNRIPQSYKTNEGASQQIVGLESQGSQGSMQTVSQDDFKSLMNAILVQQRSMEQRLASVMRKQTEVMGAQISAMKKELVSYCSKIETQMQADKAAQPKSMDAALKKVVELISRATYKEIPEAVEGAVKSGLKTGMKKHVGENGQADPVVTQEQVTEAFKSAFSQIILPGFQEACGSVMEQMNSAMNKGWNGFVKGVEELKQLTQDNLSEGTQALRGVSDRLTAQTESLAALIQDATEAGSFGFQRGEGGESLTGVLTAEELEARHNPKVSIQRDIEQGNYEDAFRKCLTTKSQQLLSWLLSFVNPETIFNTPNDGIQLSQPVIIGLIQRISLQLGDVDDEQRVRQFDWMQMLVLLLDETTRSLQSHIKSYLEEAQSSLEQFRTSEDANVRRTAIVISQMIHQKLKTLEMVAERQAGDNR